MESPPTSVPSRSISEKTKILLWVRAGGRCEFDGCNEYLFQHHLTLERVNLGELAHVVAFSASGPRGNARDRPGQIHDVANLMLLCPRCHKLIDDGETRERYSRETLMKFKEDHEARIFRLTAAKPERRTTVLQLLSRVGGQVSAIPPAHIMDAVAPMYPAEEKGYVVDLNAFDDSADAFYQLSMAEIDRVTDSLFRSGLQVGRPNHISVFALAPMPLLMYLGRRLSNKVPVSLFQRHRDGHQNWTWKEDGPDLTYSSRNVQSGGGTRCRVALLLSLTGKVDERTVGEVVGREASIFEITLEKQTLSSMILRRAEDLDGFRRAYHETLGEIARAHPDLKSLDVFPAVPAPVAVLCGFELFPKVSPGLRVFDRDLRRGGWSEILEVK